MKNVLASVLSVIVAVLIGSLFMKVSNAEEEIVEPTISTNSSVKAFQVGAFTNQASAEEEAISKEGKVSYDGEFYYVYISILSDEKNLEQMRNYLDKKNIYYYIKTIDVNQEFKDSLITYEELMKESSSEVAFMQLNQRILDMYEGEIWE